MRYRAQFKGREAGAIGIFYPITTEVDADDKDEARESLYDDYEHITGLTLTEVLRSTINEPWAGAEALAEFDNDDHPQADSHYEHGQWWITCPCGASWSVVDAVTNGEDHFDFEQIDDGEEDYHD